MSTTFDQPITDDKIYFAAIGIPIRTLSDGRRAISRRSSAV